MINGLYLGCTGEPVELLTRSKQRVMEQEVLMKLEEVVEMRLYEKEKTKDVTIKREDLILRAAIFYTDEVA